MRTLITGISGFIGYHLAEALLKRGDDVFGLSLQADTPWPQVQVYRGDITNAAVVTRVLTVVKPDVVFHLAAQSNIPRSFENPTETIKSNIIGSLNIFNAVREIIPSTTVLSVGSCAEYGSGGKSQERLPEDGVLLPSSPYAISKAAQGFFARLYAQAYHLRIIHVRPFAVIGPGKHGDAVSDFCRGIVAIERGQTEELKTGPLTMQRDFIDVRDAVQAMMLVADRGVSGEAYNICSGSGVTLQEIVSLLVRLAQRPIKLVTDPTRQRPADDRRLIGNADKFQALGHVSQYTLEQTLRDILTYWRKRS